MTANISQDAQFLRAELAKTQEALRNMPPPEEPFDYELSGAAGDDTVTLPAGWKPKRVLINGTEKRPGALNDFTTPQDADLWQVVFTTEPLVSDWIRIWAVREND